MKMEVMSIMASSRNSTLNSAIYGSTLAILLSAGINFMLPTSGVDRDVDSPFHEFHIYRLGNLFIDVKAPEKSKPKPVEKPKVEEKVYDLKKWKLKATYLGSRDLFAIIEDGKDIEIVYLDYTYKGYELVELKDDEAIFRMKGKLYSIKLDEESKKKSRKSKKEEKDLADEIIENEKREEKVEIKSSIDPTTNEIKSAKIKRDDINFYLKNAGQIWKSVRIRDYRVDKRLRGFQVTYVKNGSAFEELGLKAGDIITAINGEEITNYSQVQKYYKNIGRIKQLNLTILRDGEERDIDYDIN